MPDPVVFPDDLTLGEARDLLRSLVSEGAHCPLCTQSAKIYSRSIGSTVARSLIRLYQAGGMRFQHLPTVVGRSSSEESKLRYWGLLEEERARRPDGGRSGWWRVTPLGEQFVLGKTTVPKYAYVYANKCIRLDGEQVSIRACLGKRFSYAELMGREVALKAEEVRQVVAPPLGGSAGPGEPWEGRGADDPSDVPGLAEPTTLFEPTAGRRVAGPYDDMEAA